MSCTHALLRFCGTNAAANPTTVHKLGEFGGVLFFPPYPLKLDLGKTRTPMCHGFASLADL